ncbi:MAG: hypothetical protein CMB80_29245 [Flammeovirgaceae bacterium]|nr:hypothetical protein [Flammeovirgaceae bacterium]MBE60914.1 hypothetical protein [Flammeovirgaceae bacterium]MBR09256.1 hypothetical protein [Rickettsiales bacterium]|tara:strand:+ start:488 stop:985 length:498 start_codon:yes stop_codon:yes gene_type:complete
MKTLYIIRHAKSSWSFEVSDRDRPLGIRGRRDAPRVGKHLSQTEPTPELMISSPASRALYTALLMGDEWGYPEDEIELSEKLYHTGPSEIINLIKEQSDEIQSIALFGHNPGLTDLVNHFSTDYLDNLPTAGVYCFTFKTDSWTKISENNASKKVFIAPKRLSKN